MIEIQQTSSDLIRKAKIALTPEQYARLEKKAIEKIGVLNLATMDLDKLKSTLPSIISGEQDEIDIMTRLEVEFPGINTVTQEPKISDNLKFSEKPIDFIADQASSIISSTKKTITDAPRTIAIGVMGKGTIETIESAQKMKGFFDRFMSDPSKFISHLIDAFKSLITGDTSKLMTLFSSGIEFVGISTDVLEKFIDTIGLPAGLIKMTRSIFSTDKIGSMKYEDFAKIWKEYQKNPKIDITKQLGLQSGDLKDVVGVLEKLFGKDSNSIFDTFVAKGGKETEIARLPMTDIINRIVG